MWKQQLTMLFSQVFREALIIILLEDLQCDLSKQSPQSLRLTNDKLSRTVALADRLIELGYKLVSGGTDNHLVLVDLRPTGTDGSWSETLLDLASITLNKNSVPGVQSAMNPGGIRIGSPALTTRGLREVEFVKVTDFIHEGIQIAMKAKQTCPGSKIKDFLEYVESESCQQHGAILDLRNRVEAFATQFPIPGVGTEDLLQL